MTELWLKSVLILKHFSFLNCVGLPSSSRLCTWAGAKEVPKSHWSLLVASYFSLPPSPSSPLRGRALRSRGRTGCIFRTTLQCFELLVMETWSYGYSKGPTTNFKQLGELEGLRISMILLSLLGVLVFSCAWSALIYTYV